MERRHLIEALSFGSFIIWQEASWCLPSVSAPVEVEVGVDKEACSRGHLVVEGGAWKDQDQRAAHYPKRDQEVRVPCPVSRLLPDQAGGPAGPLARAPNVDAQVQEAQGILCQEHV